MVCGMIFSDTGWRCSRNVQHVGFKPSYILISWCVIAVTGRDKVICVNSMEANEVVNKVSRPAN